MTRWNNYPANSYKPAKYRSVKKEVDGHLFDSAKEAKRYTELKQLLELGVISGLELQKKFVLIPTQREPDTVGPRGGIKKGKVIEKECAYYADFYYFDNEKNEYVVEDTKSHITQQLAAYRIKRKLMLKEHGLRITEV